MTVNRTADQEGPSSLTVFFAPPSKSTSATGLPAPSSSTDSSTATSTRKPSDRIETIDMKHKHESEILSRLLELASGKPYEITPEEHAELRGLEDYKRSSQRDRETQARLNAVKKQEKALLDQARGVTDAV